MVISRHTQIVICLQPRPQFRRVPKQRARRNAVSAEMPRFAKTISLIRRGGTFKARANAFWDKPCGFTLVSAASFLKPL
jgi:hypothetical protein